MGSKEGTGKEIGGCRNVKATMNLRGYTFTMLDRIRNERTRAKTIKKNTNSTQNKSQTHRTKQYEVTGTSFLSTDCELSSEICSKNVYSLGPRGTMNVGEISK